MNFWNTVKMAMRMPVQENNIKSGRTFVKNGQYGYGGPTDATSGDIRIGKDIQAETDRYIDNAVPSTAVQSIDYDPKAQNAEVTFVGGKKSYSYPMTKEEFKSFMNADSKGRWINNARTY